MVNWSQESILVTGGTGSFGKKFVEIMLRDYQPQRLVIFSRDELKQHEMRTSGFDHPSMRYFIGDVRDVDRLKRALSGVTVVVHAAALKQVPACEYNPFEAIQTNIMGGRNVIDAAIDQGVRRILALSTDKAVNPINLYGATKLCAEKVFVQAATPLCKRLFPGLEMEGHRVGNSAVTVEQVSTECSGRQLQFHAEKRAP